MALKPADLLRGLDVGTLPAVYQKLVEALNSTKSSAKDIGRVVAEDPGLTARLLRIVNSPFYGFPSKIETVSHAVTVLGTQQLKELVLATSVIQMFTNVPPEIVDMESFWRHSLATGVVARGLALAKRMPDLEVYFVSGMLHDIGCLVIYMQRPEESVEILAGCKAGELAHRMERKVLGFDHTAVGRELLTNWNLPESQREVVGSHHRPKTATRFPTETAIVHVADVVADAMRYGSSGEQWVPPLEDEAWTALKLEASVVMRTLRDAEERIASAVQMFLK